MSIIIFVRHGESASNTENVLSDDAEGFPLTEFGRRQVLDTAKQLSCLKVDRIFTSPVLRARQTAEILNEARGLKIIVDERLWERHFGAIKGTPAINTKSPQALAGKRSDWRYDYIGKEIAGLESFSQLRDRINTFVDSASKLGGIALATSHGDTINALVTGKLGLDDTSGFAVRVPNASMTILSVNGKKTKIIAAGTPVLTTAMLDEF